MVYGKNVGIRYEKNGLLLLPIAKIARGLAKQ
jgi:hypothetical protein